jgi:hypothetical protein
MGKATPVLCQRSEERHCIESDVDLSGSGGHTCTPNGCADEGRWVRKWGASARQGQHLG